MGAESSRSRLTPIGLSVLVNLALIALMARMLASSPVQGQRYIAVELRVVAPSAVHRSLPPVQHSAISSQPSRPQVHRSPFTVHRSLPSVGLSPFTVHRSLPGPPAPSLPSGGGTSATGPGAFVGPGPGGGTSGPGESTITTPQPVPTPNTQHPTPNAQLPTSNFQPPTSRAAGESRTPSVARQTKPVYPSDARDEGVEGVSVVLAFIDPEGMVTGTKLEKGSGDRRLDRAALDAVGKWAFNPCLRDGVAVKSSVRVRVEFRLE